MSKLFLAMVIGLVACLSTVTQAAVYGGGSGTELDPYQIETAAHLNTIGATPGDWGMHFKLMADIDMSAYSGTQYNIIGNATTKFTGTFDGDGYVIRNLTYATGSISTYVGMFGYTDDARIQNLGIENISISVPAGSYIGGLVGYNEFETIITSCYVTGAITGQFNVGGLVGYNDVGSLIACYTTCSVTGQQNVGGMVGYNAGIITTCYSVGSVSGTTDIGGLVGSQSGGTVNSGFWNTQTSGQAVSAGGSGKTTAEMNSRATFISASWDFIYETANGTNDHWKMPYLSGRPILSWQVEEVSGLLGSESPDFNGDGKADMLWRNVNTGAKYITLMNGGARGAMQYIPDSKSFDLNIIGIADFNNDGKTDLLWESAQTGGKSVTLMDGATRGAFLAIAGSEGFDMDIVDLADFNNDGMADLLWEKASTGANYITLMNGGTRGAFLYIPDSVGFNLDIVDLADFNNDGMTDLLWEKASTGANFITLMNGGTRGPLLYIPDSMGFDLDIVDLADFNNDGMADLLWEKASTGADFITLVNGGARGAFQYIPDSKGFSLDISDLADFDGDGKTDIVWKLASTGANYITLMDGGTRGAFQFVPDSNSGTVETIVP